MATLFLVGDSTVCNYDLTVEDKEFLIPRNGYGMWLNRYFYGSLNVKNLALSGRSSLSFLKEDFYCQLKERISKGDFLVIGFGHNDEKYKDEARFTFGSGDTNNPKSFRYHLLNYYIKIAKEVGATPILCTPIVRRSDKNEYVGDRIHCIPEVNCGGIDYCASDYAEAIRILGKEFDISVIDMTAATKTYYEKVGVEGTKKLHATTSKNIEDIDNTHLNSYGAGIVAGLFVEELKKSNCELKKYLSDRDFLPIEKDLFVNQI